MAFDGRESVQLLGVSQVPYSGPGLCRTLGSTVCIGYNHNKRELYINVPGKDVLAIIVIRENCT